MVPRVSRLFGSLETVGRPGIDARHHLFCHQYHRLASKLAILLFSRALAHRHPPAVLTSNALHPGVVGTSLVRSAGWPGRFLGWATFLLRSPARGARTSVYLATNPEVATVTGGYFVDDRPARVASRARDPELAERLWSETAALLHAYDAGAVH